MGKKIFSGFKDCLKGFIVSNKPEKIENDFLEINLIKVIVCGSPIIGDKILNAKNIYTLYSKYGTANLAKKIGGNYSLVIIDEKYSINIVRDRIGLSPVYYSLINGFICSSNIGPIIKVRTENYSYNKSNRQVCFLQL